MKLLVSFPGFKQILMVSTNTSKSNLYHYTKIVALDLTPSTNFYGRVVSLKPPRETRGKDWIMNLIVIDDSFEGNADLSTQNPAGLSVNIFKPSPDEFPAVKQVGDIVQFRHFKIQYYESYIQAISTKWSAFTVFRKDEGEDSWKAYPEREIFSEEFEMIEKLSKINCGAFLSNFDPAQMDQTAVISKGPRIRATLSVSEVRHGIYFNGTFKVMKVSESSDPNQFSLLVCDYTENPFLSSNPELLNLPKYLDQSLLPVTLWDNFAEEARRLNLKPGDFVYFDNLLGRQVRHEDGTVNVVAVLHGDPKATNLENFIKLQRESKKIESQATRLAQLKQSIESEQEIVEAVKPKVEPVLPPKSAVITIKKQQTKRTFAIKKTASDNIITATAPTSADSCNFVKTFVGGDSFAITTILSVRSFPADNAKFCVKAKIVALSPASFYEMVRYVCHRCNFTTKLTQFIEESKCQHCDALPPNDPKFIWVFSLVIEDATGDLALIVADEDGSHFLNCPAFNLATPGNEEKIEKLTLNFGKMLTVENQPENLFCIKSYRVNADDGLSHLRYRLFNTKLL